MKVEMIFVVQLVWNYQVSGDGGHVFGVYWVLKWKVQTTHVYIYIYLFIFLKKINQVPRKIVPF